MDENSQDIQECKTLVKAQSWIKKGMKWIKLR